MKVYLSGGMRTEWRNRVRRDVGATWIDPTEHWLETPPEYTAADLAGIRACDVLFAYLAADNPSGLGLMLEIGYAKGLGKMIIFVDERNDKYTQIGRETADCAYNTLEEGIATLQGLYQMLWFSTR